MDFQLTALVICGAAVAYVWYKRYHAFSTNDVPGPENPSWIYGHRWWWQYEQPSVVEKNLLEKYGNVARWNGALGEGRFWVADPKTILHILQASSDQYEKPSHTKAQMKLMVDKGLAWVEGDAHKRQRRAMTPAFGLVEAKGVYPYFSRCSDSLADKWHEIISNAGSGQTAIIDLPDWFSRATLDAIGTGAFDYDFGSLENTDNKLTKSYKNLVFDAFARPSKGQLFMLDALRWVPTGLATWVFETDQSPGSVRLRENRVYVHEVAAKLIEEKRQELKDGTSRRDVLTLLVKANSSLRPDWRLNDDEIVAQVRTIMIAGHETTSRTLTMAFWELAKNRYVQERLRGEIKEKLRQIKSNGRDGFIADDFDSMPYLIALGKETLRVHPVINEMQRVPKKDSVLPLVTPIIGISGKVYKELPVPAGTLMNISIVGYNLNKDLWGPDAYEFRPERWLDTDNKFESPFGVYGNLATFSGGPRSCIGWRFAVFELHTFLVTLIRQFDFSLPENGQEVKWMRGNTPVVVGEENKGPQLQLKVTALGNE